MSWEAEELINRANEAKVCRERWDCLNVEHGRVFEGPSHEESVEIEKEKVKVIWLQVQEKKQSPRKKNDVLVELSEKYMVCERIEKKG